MIQQFPITDRQKWLDLRKNDVTGSEVGALFDVHRYLTPAKLYALKIGAMVEEDSADGVMKRGVKLESFVASDVQAMNPSWSIAKATHYYRDVEHRLGGTPDYEIADKMEPWKKGILEIKTVGHSDFTRIWRGGDPDDEIIPEPWQLLQTLTYMYLTGASFGKIAVLPVGEWEPMNIHVVDVPRREDTIKAIVDRVDQFWADIGAGIVPDFNPEKDMAVIKAFYANVKADSHLDLRYDKELRDMLEFRQQYADEEKRAKTRKEAMEASIRMKLGQYESATADGWDVTLKEQHRKAYEVKETSFRVLRTKQHTATQRKIEGVE